MNYTELNDDIKSVLLGYTKNDFEKIFEDIILPIYYGQCTLPNVKTKYKIVNRNSNSEYDYSKVLLDDFR